MTSPKTSAKRIITILGTLFCALATGFLMQHYMQGPGQGQQAPGVQVASVNQVQDVAPIAADAQNTQAEVPEVPAQDVQVESVALTAAVPVPPSTAPQPDLLPDTPVTLAALEDSPVAADLPEEEPAPAFGCEIKAYAVAGPAAMVDIAIDAPCLANSQFTVHHNGMMFTMSTDADGLQGFTVPALAREAVFIISFASGDSAVAKAEVDTLEYYDRAVVQWAGSEGLQIHALEYGATYGEAGHIWAGAEGDLALAARGEGGFVTRLGDASLFQPHLAQVYTFPTGTALADGQVFISLEAEVTEANCNKDVEAQALQKSGNGKMQARDLTLAMPDCDGVGEFLVLKNLFDDLNIARN